MTLQFDTARFLLRVQVLLIIITANVVLSDSDHYDHASNIWDRHSAEEPFLTLWNLPIKSCVEECQLRKACHAVNYCRERRSCQLLETDDGALVSQKVSNVSNVFVRMSDVRMTSSQEQTLSACSNCNINETCLTHNSSCIVKECRKLNVANGVILGNMLNVGARAKVECNDLYELDPPSQDQTVCQTDGEWTPAITCEPNTTCGPPPTVDDATFVKFTNVSNVINAVYECDVGYDTPSALNDTSVECLSNTTWRPSGFKCLAVCGVPPNVTHASVPAGDNLHGFTKMYTCDTGYAVNGSANITCQADATWSPIQFECIVDCGSPDDFPNAQLSAGNTLAGTTRTYRCMGGFVTHNVTTVDTTCQSDGSWSVPAFQCVFDCDSPPIMPNGTVSSGDTVTGSTRNYTCDYGYGTTGTATITCLGGSGWSSPTSTCTELVCDSDWHKIGESCYFTPGSGTSFESDVHTAKDFCHNYNAYLVQLENKAESDAVVFWLLQTYSDIKPWLGISDSAVEGTWKWMNSSEATNWTNWADDNPNGGLSDAYCRLRLGRDAKFRDGEWSDKESNASLQPLCEKSMKPGETPNTASYQAPD